MGKGNLILKKEAKKKLDCYVRCCLYCCFLTVFLGLGVPKVAIGSIYLFECSLQYLIPIYLIVSGCSPFLLTALFIRDKEFGVMSKVAISIAVLGALFHIAWLICGIIWIYPTYSTLTPNSYVPCPNITKNNVTTYCFQGSCNNYLVNFAFGMVTVDLIIVLICSLAAIYHFVRRKKFS